MSAPRTGLRPGRPLRGSSEVAKPQLLENVAAMVGQAREWVDADALHVDVRGLDPPQPLLHIVRLVERGDAAVIVVHHDRDPLLLYPELAERGWAAERIDGEPGEVRLRLRRA